MIKAYYTSDLDRTSDQIIELINDDTKELKENILKRFKNTESGGAGELTSREKILLNISIDEFHKSGLYDVELAFESGKLAESTERLNNFKK
jgi:hypothetical protein